MKWLIDNWTLLVVTAAVLAGVWYILKRMSSGPSEEQLLKVKEWLLYAVIMAEKELGAGTGQLKLRYVYDMFVEKFPALVSIISFELFSRLVDEALEKMRHLLEYNKDIEDYVSQQGGGHGSIRD